jgi:hypothetical protein
MQIGLSLMNQNKSMFRSRIIDVHLHDVTGISISRMKLNVNSFTEQRQTNFHNNKVRFGYFYCNVQFCVVHGKDN